ncbi:BRO-A [Dione juno nucleopolyhedrovirus]|uniref:BRO-A n=1 Tax=Dione juno nucleopolyhedrovirus TaxID=2594175 RepID=A0AAE6LC71_9ABAC|nr:BRO-A [Dione juno nucleopolyhedrovirus]QDL56981.1 BRO-A [Dione juno nucleopolyhedrovirus]
MGQRPFHPRDHRRVVIHFVVIHVDDKYKSTYGKLAPEVRASGVNTLTRRSPVLQPHTVIITKEASFNSFRHLPSSGNNVCLVN